MLNDENHNTTVHNNAAAKKPYNTDSRVNGFPHGRYARIVTPEWLNNGFMIITMSIVGIRYFTVNTRVFFPFKATALTKAQTSEILKQNGLFSSIEKRITNK